MKTKILPNFIVTGVFLLLIGTVIAPNINFNIVKASGDNDLVEVTSQACGIKGYGNTTVKLTREQYHDLEQYLMDFRARLNQTSTREEAVSLFKEAVVELDKYGLLPKGMSVEKAQKFVSRELFSMLIQNKNFDMPDDVLNLFCLFYAHAIHVYEINIWALVASFFGSLYFKYDLKIFYFLNSLFFEYSQIKPLKFMNEIGAISPVYYYFTIGLLGVQNGSDDFVKANGFSGIKIILDYGSLEAVYFGFALRVTRHE